MSPLKTRGCLESRTCLTTVSFLGESDSKAWPGRTQDPLGSGHCLLLAGAEEVSQ
jgi:hypothetical protein